MDAHAPHEPTDAASARSWILAALALGAVTLLTAGAAASPTVTASPSELAGAVVAPEPAGCTTVTYTPSSAARPQVGTWCTPDLVAGATAVVLIHGGGGRGGSRHDLRAWQDLYASRGVASLAIDHAVLDDDAGARYPLPEQNAIAAVQYVRLHEAVLGTNRVVVQGHSAGARLGGIVLTGAEDAAFAGPELWAGVPTAADGLVGFYGYYDGTQYDGTEYFGTTGGVGWAADASAGRATGPVLLWHAADDGIVPADRSREFATALGAAGKEVDLRVLPTGNHGFDGYGTPQLSPAGIEAADATLEWLASAGTADTRVTP